MINISSCYTKDHLYCQKILCPRHYILKPGGVPFVMERSPLLKNIKEADARSLKIDLWVKKKDKFGKPIQNFRDYYQPYVARSYCKEFIYNPLNHICVKCRRCHVK